MANQRTSTVMDHAIIVVSTKLPCFSTQLNQIKLDSSSMEASSIPESKRTPHHLFDSSGSIC